MTLPDCVYCRKLAGTEALAENDLVWHFPNSIALLGPWQFYQGYCILVTRQHATEFSQLDDATRRGYFEEMCLLARAIEVCYHPHKLNYEILGNQVPHLHWHLFPRYRTDPEQLKAVWLALDRADSNPVEQTRLQMGTQDRLAIRNTLRQQLITLGAPTA